MLLPLTETWMPFAMDATAKATLSSSALIIVFERLSSREFDESRTSNANPLAPLGAHRLLALGRRGVY